MFFSRLLRERFAGTPYAEHFLGDEAERYDRDAPGVYGFSRLFIGSPRF